MYNIFIVPWGSRAHQSAWNNNVIGQEGQPLKIYWVCLDHIFLRGGSSYGDDCSNSGGYIML
uniref:Uncharacterized protein n=1 Tax=Salix viminalis TaxID=40686 RepID=A0A6N2KR98_SALVM